MKQATHYSTKKEKEYFGDNGSNSFLLDGGEIKRFDLEFFLLQKDFKGESFDDVRYHIMIHRINIKKYLFLRLILLGK